jgi:hypothetical protein
MIIYIIYPIGFSQGLKDSFQNDYNQFRIGMFHGLDMKWFSKYVISDNIEIIRCGLNIPSIFYVSGKFIGNEIVVKILKENCKNIDLYNVEWYKIVEFDSLFKNESKKYRNTDRSIFNFMNKMQDSIELRKEIGKYYILNIPKFFKIRNNYDDIFKYVIKYDIFNISREKEINFSKKALIENDILYYPECDDPVIIASEDIFGKINKNFNWNYFMYKKHYII